MEFSRLECSLLQGIFPTQGSNPGPPHCRQIHYQLSSQGSPSLLHVQKINPKCLNSVKLHGEFPILAYATLLFRRRKGSLHVKYTRTSLQYCPRNVRCKSSLLQGCFNIFVEYGNRKSCMRSFMSCFHLHLYSWFGPMRDY